MWIKFDNLYINHYTMQNSYLETWYDFKVLKRHRFRREPVEQAK